MEKLVYRPWKWCVFFAWVVLIIGVAFCTLAFCVLPITNTLDILMTAALAIIFLVGAKLLYDQSRRVYIISVEGIHAFDIARNSDLYIPWENVKHAYYRNNSKAQLYLIISHTELCKKELNSLVRMSELRICAFKDKRMIVPIGNNSSVKQLVENAIPDIDSTMIDWWG